MTQSINTLPCRGVKPQKKNSKPINLDSKKQMAREVPYWLHKNRPTGTATIKTENTFDGKSDLDETPY